MIDRLDTTRRSAARRLQRLIAYRTLVRYLVFKDIKVKSRGTYLGIAWTLMNPLITIVMYYLVFQYVFRVPIPNFLAFFLIGLLMWVFFSRAVTSATTCIHDNEGIIKRMAFPLEALPLSAVLYHLFHHAVALGIALPLMIVLGSAKLSWHLLWVSGILAAFACFTLAVSLWLATIGVFFRDARDILEVGLPILFWTTPIFYTAEMLPRVLRPLVTANPLSSFIGAVRAGLLDGRAPSEGQLAWAAVWVVGMLASGAWVFSRYEPRFAEEA